MIDNRLPFIEQMYKNPKTKYQGVVFLDRDGTIIKDPNYLRSIDQVEISPGAVEGLQLLQHHKFLFIIITNQAAIARGYITIPELKRINDYVATLFLQHNIVLHAIYSCPHHPNADLADYRQECLCRKPNSAMLERAIQVFSPDLKKAYMIGDHLKDVETGKRLGIRTYLLAQNEPEDISIASKPDFCYTSLLEVAKHITSQNP